MESLADEAAAWSAGINETQPGVEWHMKVDDARSELIAVYPKIKT